MRNIDWGMVIVFVLFMLLGLAFGAGLGVQAARNNPIAYGIVCAPAATPVDTRFNVDLNELDKRDRQMAAKINAQDKQIKELYARTEYLKAILEQVIDFINGATTPTAAPQGNAL